MNGSFSQRASLLVCSFLASIPSLAFADLLRLTDGTEIHGTILTKEDDPAVPLTVKKLSGEQVILPHSAVKFTLRRPLVQEEYLDRLERLPETLEAHWKLAEWCRNANLREERETHLRRVLDFDPQHPQAHRALNHVFSNGEWITSEEMMIRQGYVIYSGRYFGPQEVELAEHFQRLKDVHADWQKKVTQWQKGLAGDRPDIARASLNRISDPNAVPALVHSFQDAPLGDHRRMLVAILSHIRSQESTFGLVMQSLLDSSDEIRQAAFTSIPSESRQDAVYWYIRALKHPWNPVVNRSAGYIAQLDDQHTATLPLIESVSTLHLDQRVRTHRCGVDLCPMCLPSRRIVWDRNGSVPLGYGFPAATAPSGTYFPVNWDGTAKLTPVKMPEEVEVRGMVSKQNPEVLNVLKESTSHDFKYDKNAWRQWWAAEHPQAIVMKP